MKKAVVTLLVLAVILLGWNSLRNLRVSMADEKGILKEVRRDDLTIPINATGEIRYESVTEIKSEASGTVEERRFQAGDLINRDDVLILLSRDDEKRNVDRAEADLVRADANYKRARITLRERKEIGPKRAQANLDSIIAQLNDAKYDYEWKQGLGLGRGTNESELSRAKALFGRLQANKKGAEAELKQAAIAVELAEEDVRLMTAAHTVAEENLQDANERLKETTILSPIDGMVLQMLVQEGEVIQTGKATFGGGTVLARIADISKVYVRAEVDEADFGVIRDDVAPLSARFGGNVAGAAAGEAMSEATVKVRVEAYPDEEFFGVIERLYPEPRKAASVVTYYVDIVITSDNREKLAMGMQADVEFTAQSVSDVLLVRHDAIHEEEGQLGVYVPGPADAQADPEPRFIPCGFGMDNGIYAQLVRGDLKEGDRVYTKLPRSTDDEDD